MEQTLKNDQLLRSLCFAYEQSSETKVKQRQSSPSKDPGRFYDSEKSRESSPIKSSRSVSETSLFVKKKKGSIDKI